MISLLFLTYSNVYSLNIQDNIIQNTCNFNIIRIDKNDLECIDYGINKKYCNHNSLPNEFIITKEIGINNKENIIIKPYAMWIIIRENEKKKIADFYYTFTCNNIDNIPKLVLNIFPKKEFDLSMYEDVIVVIFVIILIFIFLLLFALICPCMLNNNNFWTGYIIGNLFTNESTRKKIYCE